MESTLVSRFWLPAGTSVTASRSIAAIAENFIQTPLGQVDSWRLTVDSMLILACILCVLRVSVVIFLLCVFAVNLITNKSKILSRTERHDSQSKGLPGK